MDLDQVPSLWRNKPVEFECSEPGELVKIHLIALLLSFNKLLLVKKSWIVSIPDQIARDGTKVIATESHNSN